MRSLLIFIIALQSVLPQSSEKLIYEVRYKLGVLNTKVATGVIPLTQDTWEGKDVFRSDARITVQPVFKLFMNPEYTAILYLKASDMQPLFYSYAYKKGYNECRYLEDSIYYHRQLHGKEPENTCLPNDGRTMEIFSMLFMLRDINLEAGETCEAKTYLGGGFRNVRITMQGTDSKRFKGRKADYFIIQTPERGLMENGSGNIIKLWRAHDGTRPVLGLEVPLSKGTMICNLTYEL